MFKNKTLNKALKYIQKSIDEVWENQHEWQISDYAHVELGTLLCALWRCHAYVEIFKKYKLKKHHDDLKKELIVEFDCIAGVLSQLKENFSEETEVGMALKYIILHLRKVMRILNLEI